MSTKKIAFRSMCWMIAFLFTLGFLTAEYVQAAEPLFKELPGDSPLLQKKGVEAGIDNPTVVRERILDINFPQLGSTARAKTGSKLLLNLFPDTSLLAEGKGKAGAAGEWDTWLGAIDDSPQSSVVIVFSGETLAGNIVTDNTMYKVRPLEGGACLVQEIDPSAFPPEGPPVIPENLPATSDADPIPPP